MDSSLQSEEKIINKVSLGSVDRYPHYLLLYRKPKESIIEVINLFPLIIDQIYGRFLAEATQTEETLQVCMKILVKETEIDFRRHSRSNITNRVY